MLFYGVMSISPTLNNLNGERISRKENRKRKRGDLYDPETSVYSNKSEHDICTAIKNWDR